jgi:PASTA domain
MSPGKEPRDRWWMPILVGILVLVLLAALGWGIYLIVQNVGKNNSPAPAVTTSASPAPSTAVTTRTTPPSTAATTPSPTPSTTTNPTRASVTIPALRGLSVADAKSALLEAGISATRVVYRPSSADEGTVFDSDPKEGQEVPPDTTVTLIVAAPSLPATTAAPSTASTTGN